MHSMKINARFKNTGAVDSSSRVIFPGLMKDSVVLNFQRLTANDVAQKNVELSVEAQPLSISKSFSLLQKNSKQLAEKSASLA